MLWLCGSCYKDPSCDHPCFELIHVMNVIRACELNWSNGIYKCPDCKHKQDPRCVFNKHRDLFEKLTRKQLG